VALLLGGEPAAAGRLLDGLRPDGRVLELAVRLARHAATAAAGEPVDRDLVECLALDASREGVMWVDRQCRALLPWLGTPGADTLDHVAGSSVVAECDEIGDSWGALLASAADALGRLVSGRRSSPSWVEVERRAVGLDAGTVVAWAAAFGALAAARDRQPGADATRAARLARAFGVPGAAAVAAVAAGSSVDRDRVPLWLGRLIRRGVRSESPSPAVDLLAGPVAGTALNAARGSTALEAAGAAPMTLQCFGGFRLLIAGREPDWSVVRPRAAATLRLLAINAGRPVHRETLLEALWPAVDAGQATRNLQVAISSLRRLLEPTVARGETAIIVRAADAYALVPPAGSEVDVVAFREGLDAARKARGLGDVAGERAALIDLVAAYGGDLLPADGPAEWLVAERERARLAAAAAAERLAELEARLGDHPAAVAAARRGLEIDQFRDATWRVLIAACDAAGDAAAARRARQEYSAVLHELGLPGRQGELVAT
jgi:DNA-binding SARP family transcriptional activator